MPKTAPTTDLINDLDWLIQELNQLSSLTDVVPFEEKPGPLLSITGLLSEWLRECLEFCTPALFQRASAYIVPETTQEVISVSISLRKDWILRLNDSSFDWDRIVYSDDEADVSARQLCEYIVKQERGLFKEIAERIMTLQKPVP
jgi:hypothetical protein